MKYNGSLRGRVTEECTLLVGYERSALHEADGVLDGRERRRIL